MKESPYKDLIIQQSRKHNFDPVIIASIIEVESSFNTFAFRYETNSKTFVDVERFAKKSGITKKSEIVAQKTSWGLGQVMGSTARWLGYDGILTALVEPQLGIEWCWKAFERLGRKYESITDKIAAYNAGSARPNEAGKYSNQAYVDKVLRAYAYNRD